MKKFRFIRMEIRHGAVALSLIHRLIRPVTMMIIAMCNRINLPVFVNYESMELELKSGDWRRVGGFGVS
jgi:hypothetical protein